MVPRTSITSSEDVSLHGLSSLPISAKGDVIHSFVATSTYGPRGMSAPLITLSKAGKDGAQQLSVDDPTQQSIQGTRRPQKDPVTSDERNNTVPSSSALAVYSDEWQLDEVFPEIEMCTLILRQAGKRMEDQTHEGTLLNSDGLTPII